MDAMALASTLVGLPPSTTVAYKDDLLTYSELIDRAASALTSAANKPIDASVVNQVNANLSTKTSTPFDPVAIEDVKDKLAGI